MASDIDRAGVAKAYGRWAPVYDLVFGKVFEHGPAKFVFMFVIGFVVITHVAILIVMMASGMH